MERSKASPESQLLGALCEAEDTEEMFWLRQSDDCQSKAALGNALSAQYRFHEAAAAFEQALRIREDPALYLRLGGAYLTVRDFDASYGAYRRFLDLGGDESSAAYPLGVWHYLRGEYSTAAEWFAKCLPCDDETAIAVIYWHCLCCLRRGSRSELLERYHPDMKAGHHTAYRAAVSLFAGETDIGSALEAAENEHDELNYIIAAYGLCVFLSSGGQRERGNALLRDILSRKTVWPCIPWLAAWNDAHGAT